MKQNKLWICSLCILLATCTTQVEKTDENSKVALPDTDKAEVEIQVLAPSEFYHEIMSNGRIQAHRSADLSFSSSEVIAEVLVRNGQHVRKGQPIARLDLFRLQNRLQQTENSMKQAHLEWQNILYGQGYTPDQLDSVPDAISEIAAIRSGYAQSKAQYELAQYELDHATITAPFDGVVANLFDKVHNQASSSTAFCRIIDTRTMEVEFTVLENELMTLAVGSPVSVRPYAGSNQVYTGSICEINPIVDIRGMVKVKARISDGGKLYEGMNVRVHVRYAIPDQYVVPKTAVVLRNGRQVVFTEREGYAHWNYVETIHENSDSYTVNGLQEGDRVIVSGNINMAHETPVTIVK